MKILENNRDIIKRLEANEIRFVDLPSDTIYELSFDRDVMYSAINQNFHNIEFASRDLKKDVDFFNLFIDKYPDIIMYGSSEMQNNKDIAKKIISKTGWLLQYFSKEVKDDEDVIKIAIKNDGSAFYFASERIRDSYEFNLMALKHKCFLPYIPDKFKSERLFVEIAVMNYGNDLKYAPTWFKNDDDLVNKAVNQIPTAYAYASQRLRSNFELTKKVLIKSIQGIAIPILEYSSKELKSDSDLLLVMLHGDIFYFNLFMNRQLKNEIIKEPSNDNFGFDEIRYYDNSINGNPNNLLKLFNNEVLLAGFKTENIFVKKAIRGLKRLLSQKDQLFFLQCFQNVNKKYNCFDKLAKRERNFPENTFDLIFEYMETSTVLVAKKDVTHKTIFKILDAELLKRMKQ